MKKYFSEEYLENYYYIFFAIMIINQFLPVDAPEYLSMVLGILGFLLIIPKIILTKYTKKEAWIIVLVGILSILTFVTTRRQGLLFSAIAIVAIKNVDIKKCIRMILILGGSIFLFVIFRYIITNGLSSEITSTRYIFGMEVNVYKTAFGYNHANKTFLLFSILIMSFIYLNYGKVTKTQWFIILCLTLGMFYYTFSRTGLIVILFSIIYYFVLESKLYNNSIFKKILNSVPLLSVAISFILPYIYKWGKVPFISEINKMMSDRIYLSYEFLRYFKPKLFGQNVDNLNAYRAQTNNWYLVCDNSYVLILCAYGVVVFLLCLYLIYRLSIKAKEDKSILFILSSFCVYGIAEAFFIIFLVNFSMLFIKDILFKKTYDEEMNLFKCLLSRG